MVNERNAFNRAVSDISRGLPVTAYRVIRYPASCSSTASLDIKRHLLPLLPFGSRMGMPEKSHCCVFLTASSAMFEGVEIERDGEEGIEAATVSLLDDLEISL